MSNLERITIVHQIQFICIKRRLTFESEKMNYIKASIEYKQNEQKHQIKLPSFISQFLLFFKIGYHIGIVPFKLKFDQKSGIIHLHSTVVSKVETF